MPTSYRVTLSDEPVIRVPSQAVAQAIGDKSVNYYRCPVGFTPGICEVLLTRDAIDKIKSRESHEFGIETMATAGEFPPAEFPDEEFPVGSSFQILVKNLYWLSERRLSGGAAGGKNAVYLVRLADKRVLGERWSDTGLYAANVLKHGHDESSLPYLDAKKTWQQIVTSLWPATLGTAPTLPFSPGWEPDDFLQYGQNAWRVLEDIATHLCLWLVYNPLTDGFAWKKWGETQAAPTTVPGTPIYDADPITANRLAIPEKLAVYFPDHWQNHGAERDIPLTSNWLVGPPIEKQSGQVAELGEMPSAEFPEEEFPTASGADQVIAGTIGRLWAPFHRRYDRSGGDTNYLARNNYVQYATGRYQAELQITDEHRRYDGIVAYLPGPRYKQVIWGAIGSPMSAGGNVLATEYVVHRGRPMCDGDCPVIPTDSFAPTDFGQRTFPNWPHVTHVVRLYDSSKSVGEQVAASGDGFFPGKVYGYSGGLTEWHACAIKALDSTATVENGAYGVGRILGTVLSGSGVVPLYAMRVGSGTTTPGTQLPTMYVGFVKTTITAYDPDTRTPGEGVVAIYHRDDTTGDLVGDDTDQTVYNLGYQRYDHTGSGCGAVEIFKDGAGQWWVVPEVTQIGTAVAATDFTDASVSVELTGSITTYTGQPIQSSKLTVATASNLLKLTGKAGDTVLVLRLQDGGTWMAINVRTRAKTPRIGTATLTGVIGATDGIAGIDNLHLWSGDAPTTLPTSALNLYGCAGTYGDPCVVMETDVANTWVVITVRHKPIDVAVGWRISGTKIQLQQRSCAIMTGEDARWVDIDTVAECG